MEPAVKRREHPGRARPVAGPTGAAMEPAERREHQRLVDSGADHPGVGMEPAAERREHFVGLGEQVGDFPAAMEPAAKRREHPATCTGRAGCTPRRNGARRSTAGAPPRLGNLRPGGADAANGARRSTAGARSRVGQGRPVGRAAMEPAANRREHRHRAAVLRLVVVAAMEPAANRREHRLYSLFFNGDFFKPQWSPPLSAGARRPGTRWPCPPAPCSEARRQAAGARARSTAS
jgi:hypothetical protein